MFDLKKATEEEMQACYDKAYDLGNRAAGESTQEMIVVYEADVYENRVGPDYDPIPICGFGWVNIKPGNSRFARWLVKEGYARKDSYYGGVCIWIGAHEQSYDKKLAHANAMANHFQEYGIKCYASGRLD